MKILLTFNLCKFKHLVLAFTTIVDLYLFGKLTLLYISKACI